MDNTFKTISAAEFAALDLTKYTLVDLREPDELLVSGIAGAINIPFSQFAAKLDDIPKDKPVIVYCRVGDFSEQIAEILADRGYDVALVKVADFLRDQPDGTRVHVEATEDAFYSDIRVWCARTGNRLDNITFTDGIIHADVTRQTQTAPTAQTGQNDKTFVVFSGDLDKTIAAFIMANGAAAMGRSVTIFFTFWGLNILRRPERVKVKKAFIERMFGIMMPRGTKQLGLSRMNMGGAGAKMIRGIMQSKGVSSLEELIDSATMHGVRLVACQMSMDIMGIRKEELIDGVELGGVSTFLGSGEQSDMSLFI